MNYDKFLRRILLFSSYNYQLLYREARDYMAAWWYRLHAVLKVTEHKYSARDRLSHLSKIGTGGIRSASSNEFTPWVVTKVGICLEYYIMSLSSSSSPGAVHAA